MDRIRPHLVPLILGGLGLILIIFGLAQVILRSASSKVDFQPASENSNISTETIMVDVEGAVMKPGVYKIGSNSRLVDALAAAGGMSEDANRDYVQKNIN
ncbi:MAG: SLBB domain-containing protein, partial [Patescibacteria group bacterium]